MCRWQTLSCLYVCVCVRSTLSDLLCSQWDVWGAPASAVLPERRDAHEWTVHVSVWPRLLLEHPLTGVLRLHPGKDTTP